MFKKLNRKLEAIFDQSPQTLSAPETETPFVLIENYELLKNLSYSFGHASVNHSDLLKLFSQLTCFFPAGLLLKRQPQSSSFTLSASFLNGQILHTENNKSIRLPATRVYKVLATPAKNILNRFDLPTGDTVDTMTCYALTLHENYRLVVASREAEPWAKLQIETLQNTLMKIDFNL